MNKKWHILLTAVWTILTFASEKEQPKVFFNSEMLDEFDAIGKRLIKEEYTIYAHYRRLRSKSECPNNHIFLMLERYDNVVDECREIRNNELREMEDAFKKCVDSVEKLLNESSQESYFSGKLCKILSLGLAQNT